MIKKAFPELLDELNNEERKKFEYLLNFYSQEHVFYNFEHYRHALKDFNLIRYEAFSKPLEPEFKRIANSIDFRNICENFEDFRTYWKSDVDKDVADFLIFLTTYTKVNRNSTYKVIESSKKYEALVKTGEITPEEIFTIIKVAFESYSESQEPIDLSKVEFRINEALRDRLRNKMDRMTLEQSLEEAPISQRIIVLSNDILSKLSTQEIEEAYRFQGNVHSSKNSSILVIKAIMGDSFCELTDDLAERLKAMLRRFDLAKMKGSELKLFQDNLSEIISKGYDIEDIFFVKNIVASESALTAYSELPEELQRQVLRVNILADQAEITQVLSALSECKEEKEPEGLEYLERNISRLPLEKRQELREALKERNSNGYKQKLNLDPRITLGFELEVKGLSPEMLEEFRKQKKVYSYFKEKQGLRNGFDRWNVDYDGTLKGKGLELISPVQSDCEEDWDRFKDACDSLKILGAYVDEDCGGHIHVGARILGSDENAWRNLFDIWRHAEELMFKMSNAPGNQLRPEVKFQASPTEPIINEMFENDSIKINSYSDVEKVATEYTRKSILGYSSSGRTKAMNLQCIAEGKQNTIEFRIPNGSVDSTEIQRTANIYARIIQTAKMLSENENWKSDIFLNFKRAGNPEEKLSYFLDLLFDDIDDKLFYYDRYFSRDGKLLLSGVPYQEIIDGEVRTDENARYEWRGYR